MPITPTEKYIFVFASAQNPSSYYIFDYDVDGLKNKADLADGNISVTSDFVKATPLYSAHLAIMIGQQLHQIGNIAELYLIEWNPSCKGISSTQLLHFLAEEQD